ncbi:MAG: glutamate synthase subunit alpha, partial [Aquificae bacterium]|nr:glutamate synthase subunit alpha [Aquificota bacterium]
MWQEMDSCGVGFVCDIHGRKSHELLKQGITAVKNLTHRGAIGGDGKTGDGAGILTEIPRKLILREIDRLGYKLSDEENLAVGMFFLYGELEEKIEEIFKEEGIKPVGWREVPVNKEAVGQVALKVMPTIKQLFLDLEGIPEEERQLRLYFARRRIEKKYEKDVYVASLSDRTIVYKGMLVAPQLDNFYEDLKDEDYETSFVLFHQRYSTNTLPNWRLAQPLRYLAHNGEINTIQGNRNWMLTLQHELTHELLKGREELIKPLVSHEESDSASLDKVFELLCLVGYKPEHAMYMLIPPAWEAVPELSPEVRAFLEYESLLMKPWDGPAAIAFTDGKTIGAHLDRNGLRPARYVITEDGLVVLGSEVGMVELGNRKILEKGRLGPGDTLIVEIGKGKIKKTKEILEELANSKPYKEWIEKNLLRLSEIEKKYKLQKPKEDPERIRKLVAFGWTEEEIKNPIKYMAENGNEMTWAMGDDTPLPPLSEKPQLLYRYFKQRFAQVTNPPIDPIREKAVMSLRMNLGYKRNFLKETEEHAKRLQIDSPILLDYQLKAIEEQDRFKVVRIPIAYPKERSYNIVELQDMAGERRVSEILMDALYEEIPINDMKLGIETLQRRVEEAVREGADIIILSDRYISKYRVAIPALLAVSASVKHLARLGLAHKVSFIVETGEARDSHQIACLIGYGASAVYPYLAYEVIHDMVQKGEINLPYEEAVFKYKEALEKGLLKIMSKMGISTLNSYQGAQIFDSVCLNKDFVEEYFTGTPVTLEADGIDEIEASTLARHNAGYETDEPKLDVGGHMKARKGGEFHAWSPEVV